MRRRLVALVALLALAGLAAPVTGAGAHGGAQTAAQASLDGADVVEQVNESNATESGTEAPEDETEIVAQVDDWIEIVSYEYDQENETMHVTLRNTGDDDRSVTITEIVTADDGQGERSSLRFGIGIFEIDPDDGEVTVSVDVRDRGDMAGVTVTTQESAEEGHGEALMVDLGGGGGGGLISGQPTGGQVRAGALAGGVGSILLMIMGSWQYVATRNEDVKEADLSPRLSLLGRFRDD